MDLYLFFLILKKKNKSFIGDTGTIPIGFIIGWLFLTLCDFGYFFSALMIILYYIFDIAYTLSVRIIKKKSIFVRHNDFIFKKFNLKFGIKKLYYFLIPLNILFIIISLIFNDQFIY